MLQLNATIVRGLTYCKIFARHWALKKYGLQNIFWEGGKPYPASGPKQSD